MKQIIAERKMFFRAKGSLEKKPLTIRIGTPYLDQAGMAKCPVEWDGLFKQYADIAGMDSLQALKLASDVEPMLHRLSEKYEFFWDSGEPYFDDPTSS